MLDALGWIATAVFTASYLSRDAPALRRAQMLGALLWVAYGLVLPARPVVVANLLVFGAAAAASWRARRAPGAGGVRDEPSRIAGVTRALPAVRDRCDRAAPAISRLEC